MNVRDVLSSELGVTLHADEPFSDQRDLATLARVESKRLAKALAKGGPCISLAISALELAEECDLDDEDLRVLARAGRHMRVDPAWVDALLAASDLETLQRFVDLQTKHSSVSAALARAIDPLALELAGPNRALAARILGAIAQHHDKLRGDVAKTVPRLIELVGDEEARRSAVSALAAIGDERAARPIVALLEDPRVDDYTKAWYGAEAALRLGATEATAALVALFERTTDAVQRSHCVRALATLGPELAAPSVVRLWKPTEANAHVLQIALAGALAKDAASLAFLERASREMGHLRSNALANVARVKGSDALDELCKGAVDASDLVRWSAVAALHELRDPRSFDALVASLALSTNTAATVLRELGDVRAIPHLVAALAKDHGYHQLDVMMKESVIEALGDFGQDVPEVWRALLARVGHRRDHVGECAAIALQQLRPGCAEGVPQLVRKISRIPNVPELVERNTLPMLARLRLHGAPRDPEAARAIASALRDLRATLRGPKKVLTALDASILEWSRTD